MGSQEMIKRNVLSFTRAQENQADQAGLHFLERAGVSARGMASFLERLAADEARATSASAAHTRTHPLTRDRIDAVQTFVDRSRHAGAKPSADLVEAHQRLQQKLLAYLRPAEVLRKFGPDEASFVGRYARAYALHRRNDVAGAVALLDRLAAERPRDAYVQELKGQALMNANRPAEAVPALRAAALLAPQSALVQTQLAHALIESNGDVEEAVRALDAALRFEPRSAEAWRLSSIAWTRKGDQVRAGLSTAEAALARGDAPAARHWATRTQSMAARGSPSWLRADDILRSLSSG
jgi:predicted Zn-dependent protease